MIKPINALLTSFLSKDHWKNNLLDHWPDIIGNLYHRVTLEKIYNDTIILGVYDSAWLQELYLLSPVILESINTKLDQPRIKQLRFKQVTRKKTQQKTFSDNTKKSTTTRTLTQKEQNALTKINDEELRNFLKNFLIRCYKERE
jgi:Dna[CI] antecedent, DciA